MTKSCNHEFKLQKENKDYNRNGHWPNCHECDLTHKLDHYAIIICTKCGETKKKNLN